MRDSKCDNILLVFNDDLNVLYKEILQDCDFKLSRYILNYLRDIKNMLNNDVDFFRIKSQSIGYLENGGHINYELATKMYETEKLVSNVSTDFDFSDMNNALLMTIYDIQLLLIRNMSLVNYEECLTFCLRLIEDANNILLNTFDYESSNIKLSFSVLDRLSQKRSH